MKYKVGDVVQCVEKEREEYGFKVGNHYKIITIKGNHVQFTNEKWWNTYKYPDDFKPVP